MQLMDNPRIHICCWIFSMQLLTVSAFAQHLKLGNEPSAVTKSAVLELESPNQGLLLTRVPDTNVLNTLSPPDGMIIYFTDGPTAVPYGDNAGIFERKNGGWRKIQTAFSPNVISDQSVIKFYRIGDSLFLNIPNASGTKRGVMSGGKQTFYGKKYFKTSVTLQSLHPGSVVFVGNDGTGNADTLSENNTNFYWDNDNARLGIRTNEPAASLDVQGDFKLGTDGSILAHIIRDTLITTQQIQINSGDHHLFTLTSPAVSAGGCVVISPSTSLPDGIVIAYGYTIDGLVCFKVENVGTPVTLNIGTIFYLTVMQ